MAPKASPPFPLPTYRPMMFPSLSSKILVGNAVTPYSFTASNCSTFSLFSTCNQVKPSSVIAVVHSLCRSSAVLACSLAIPIISKPLFLNLLYNSFKCGWLARHGWHQLPQKSSSTYRPLRALKSTAVPFRSFLAAANEVSFCL